MTFVNETTFDKITLPEKVYKYRNWTNPEHKRLLTDNEIFFAAPNKIDEQHECNLETDYDSISLEKIYEFAYSRAEEWGVTDEEIKRNFAEMTVKTTPFFDEAHRASMEERFRQTLNERLTIFCVSEFNNNTTLWDSFAGGHKGFCVGINTKKMFDNKEILGGGGKVNYYPPKEMPKRNALTFSSLESIDDMLKVIFSLPDFFSSENEYRLFKMDIKDRQAKISQESIEEIILGTYILKKDKDQIIAVSKEKFPHAVILQAKFNISNNSFDFEKID